MLILIHVANTHPKLVKSKYVHLMLTVKLFMKWIDQHVKENKNRKACSKCKLLTRTHIFNPKMCIKCNQYERLFQTR